jgi:hypothetical protein
VSIPVALDQLRDAIDGSTSSPYLVTVAHDARPHCVSVSVDWRADTLVAAVGTTTLTNATAHPLVSLLWPPSEPHGYTLIVNATAVDRSDHHVVLQPTSAVLHRRAASGGLATPVGDADCIPVVRS